MAKQTGEPLPTTKLQPPVKIIPPPPIKMVPPPKGK
jgi:hypothetical protein